MDTLIDAASFSPESLQSPSAWMGHLPLAAWVIREVSPRIFVELGTHTANSYFSFCQSVIEAGLATKCYAVDTWHGDEHAGQYGEEVFTEVNTHNEERYARFSRLLRMTFDDAAGYFSDESIELLHIDGLHTYAAVRHDFETWLPKLAPGAIVMFHDTGVRELDFGVWKLWEELQAQYPNSIEFSHSHGLGILQLNDAPDARRQKWLQLDVSGKDRLRTYFRALGSRQLERFELNSELSTLKHQITDLGRAVAERDVLIADSRHHASNLELEVTAREAVIADSRHHASNLGLEVTAREAVIADLRRHASNIGLEVTAREAVIADLRHHASNLELEVTAREAVIADLRHHASNVGQEVSIRDAAIASLGHALAARDSLIADLTRDVHAFHHSTSWRITAPLRWISDGVKKARHAAYATVGRNE